MCRATGCRFVASLLRLARYRAATRSPASLAHRPSHPRFNTSQIAVRHVWTVVTHRLTRWFVCRTLAGRFVTVVVVFDWPATTIELVKRERVRGGTVLLMERVPTRDTKHTLQGFVYDSVVAGHRSEHVETSIPQGFVCNRRGVEWQAAELAVAIGHGDVTADFLLRSVAPYWCLYAHPDGYASLTRLRARRRSLRDDVRQASPS